MIGLGWIGDSMVRRNPEWDWNTRTASDVYAQAPHTGRAGCCWYSGATGWMVQFILESLLGLKVAVEWHGPAPARVVK